MLCESISADGGGSAITNQAQISWLSVPAVSWRTPHPQHHMRPTTMDGRGTQRKGHLVGGAFRRWELSDLLNLTL